jgi:DNA gyrase subunit B/topoisomerase-4 subunit B
MTRPPVPAPRPAAAAPFGLPVKLHDCTLHGPESGAELFIVEGDSAGAAVAAVRDPHHQAVLPLQGKPLNAARASRARVLADPVLGALAQALGIAPAPDAARDHAHPALPASLRYERVLLLHDPDADGIHIGALLLMYFDQWMPALLDAGRIERVHAPIGEVHGAPGTAPAQAFGDAHFRALCERARAQHGAAFAARRYRGLGGIGTTALRGTCIDPTTRMTSVLDAGDAGHAARVFGTRRAAPLGQQA